MTKIQRGAVIRTANAWDGLRSGTQTATTTPAPLSTGHLPIMEVIVQNDPDSSVSAFVGDARNQEFQLVAGASVTVPVCDLTLVYVRTESGTATVNWLAGE
jgi:hypothetical protein